MSIDWDKPVQTRDGCEVRIYTTEGSKMHYPVVGEYVNAGHYEIGRWSSKGHWNCACIHAEDRDLVNVAEQHTVTINVYKSHGSLSFLHYDSRRIAEQLVQEGCIARIEVTFTEGEGL